MNRTSESTFSYNAFLMQLNLYFKFKFSLRIWGLIVSNYLRDIMLIIIIIVAFDTKTDYKGALPYYEHSSVHSKIQTSDSRTDQIM